jgi:hypothetical protein
MYKFCLIFRLRIVGIIPTSERNVVVKGPLICCLIMNDICSICVVEESHVHVPGSRFQCTSKFV